MHLLFRCDANAHIGFGHVSRCLSLAAEALRRAHQVSFVSLNPLSQMLQLDPRIRGYHAATEAELSQQLTQLSVDCLLLDGYHLSAADLALYQGLSRYTVLLDDVQQTCPLAVDWLLSPAGSRNLVYYQQHYPQAQWLCGYDYALVNQHFLEAQVAYQQRRLSLVSFGGSDVKKLTLPVVDYLCQQGLSDVHVVVTDAMGALVDELGNYSLTIHQNLSPFDMAKLMGQAKMAVVAAGSTLFELACCGVPSVICQVADNQTNAVNDFSRDAGFIGLDCRQSFSLEKLAAAWQRLNQQDLLTRHQQAKMMVDGQGCRRVIQAIEQGDGEC